MTNWPAVIVHADLDAFYAAVEQLDDPSLRGKPVLIGPNSYRGVVLTASYEARVFGVGSAMPVASLDEAFLDMSGAEAFFGSPESIGRKIKQAVFEATQLHISVGVASTKYVAKVASGHNKPNGLTVVEPQNTVAWLAPLPVSKLWGVGPKTAAKLKSAGITHIRDITALDERTLTRNLGSMGARLLQLANGTDPRRVESSRRSRSIGSDRTLSNDISDPSEIAQHLKRAADRIARRVRAKGLKAGGIRVRLKTSAHQLLSRQCQLGNPSDTALDYYTTAKTLLPMFDNPGPFRLVGMTAFDLVEQDNIAQQLDLFSQTKPRQLEVTIDELGKRFGANTLVRAKDLGKPGTVTDGVNLDFLESTDDNSDV